MHLTLVPGGLSIMVTLIWWKKTLTTNPSCLHCQWLTISASISFLQTLPKGNLLWLSFQGKRFFSFILSPFSFDRHLKEPFARHHLLAPKKAGHAWVHNMLSTALKYWFPVGKAPGDRCPPWWWYIHCIGIGFHTRIWHLHWTILENKIILWRQIAWGLIQYEHAILPVYEILLRR